MAQPRDVHVPLEFLGHEARLLPSDFVFQLGRLQRKPRSGRATIWQNRRRDFAVRYGLPIFLLLYWAWQLGVVSSVAAAGICR